MTERTIGVCVIGDEKVGKSQLLLRFAQQQFGSCPRFHNYERDFDVYGQLVKIRALDTPSEESQVKVRQLLYASTDVFLFCCPCDKESALSNLEKRWLVELKKAKHAKSPILLILTKCDLRKDPQVSTSTLLESQQITQVASRLRVADYFECSAKTGENVDALFKRAAELALQNESATKHRCLIL